jgi:hypothetical protein
MDFTVSGNIQTEEDATLRDPSMFSVHERALTTSETPNVNYASFSPSAARIVPGSARQLSDEEWDNLKDLLHKLYIQENKTLEKIRIILREQHGLVLS